MDPAMTSKDYNISTRGEGCVHSGKYLAKLVPIVRYLVEFHRYGGRCLRHAARAVGGAEK